MFDSSVIAVAKLLCVAVDNLTLNKIVGLQHSLEIMVGTTFKWNYLTALLLLFSCLWSSGWILVVQMIFPLFWAYSTYLYSMWVFTITHHFSSFNFHVPFFFFQFSMNLLWYVCVGIRWWNAIYFLKRKESHSKRILWYVFLLHLNFLTSFFFSLQVWDQLTSYNDEMLLNAAVIYPSLRLLEGEFNAFRNKDERSSCRQVVRRKRLEKFFDEDQEEDDECGICMENSGKMVLPNCGHSLCISCFHDWYCQMHHFFTFIRLIYIIILSL